MANNGKKEIEQKAPKDSSKPIDKSYPVDDKAIEEQTQRLRKAAAAGAVALRPSPSTPSKPEPTVTAAQPSTPLTTIAALWPSPPQTPAPAPAPHLPKARAVSSPPLAPAPQPPKSRPVSSPPVTPALKASKPQTVSVKFTLTKPDAKSVSVCGEFNGWSVGATPMKRRRDGQWETVLELKPGRYQYKFVVDGEWLHDPVARESITNPHGSLNSVIAVS